MLQGPSLRSRGPGPSPARSGWALGCLLSGSACVLSQPGLHAPLNPSKCYPAPCKRALTSPETSPTPWSTSLKSVYACCLLPKWHVLNYDCVVSFHQLLVFLFDLSWPFFSTHRKFLEGVGPVFYIFASPQQRTRRSKDSGRTRW